MKRKVPAFIFIVLLLFVARAAIAFPSVKKIIPSKLAIAGNSFQITYNSIQTNTSDIQLQSQNGTQGTGTLHFLNKSTWGTATLGTNSYTVYITPTTTNVDLIPKLIIPTKPDFIPIYGTNTAKLSSKIAAKAATLTTNTLPVVINVMLLYTAAALTNAGSESTMLAHWMYSLNEANQGFKNSGIQLTLNPVYIGLFNYTEYPADLASDSYTICTNPAIHLLQQQYHASIVSIFVKTLDPNYSGVASGGWGHSLGGPELDSWAAYSAISCLYWGGNNVFAHEVGHNLGCDHDRNHTVFAAEFDYSYGEQFRCTNWGLPLWGYTIMTYPDYSVGGSGPYQCNSYSGPNCTFWGGKTGTATENNILTIQQMAPLVASFYGPITNYITLNFDGTGQVIQSSNVVITADEVIQGSDNQTVTLTASNNFICWTGFTNTTNQTISFSLNQTTNLTAHFTDGTYPIAPFLETQPISQSISNNGSLNLSVIGLGIPTPDFYWYFNGNFYQNGNTIAIPAATTNNQGTYQCIISNASGIVTSSIANVSVGQYPVILQQPVSLQDAYPASFSVQVDAVTATFQWYRGLGTPIIGATNATLSFSSYQGSDMDIYYVIVTLGDKSVKSDNAMLKISGFSPVIYPSALSNVVARGSNLTLAVTAVSASTTYWWYSDTSIRSSNGMNNSCIVLTNIQDLQTHYYYVRVGGNCASKNSPTFYVYVYDPVVILSQSGDNIVTNNNTVNLSVNTTGSSPISYTVTLRDKSWSGFWIGLWRSQRDWRGDSWRFGHGGGTWAEGG